MCCNDPADCSGKKRKKTEKTGVRVTKRGMQYHKGVCFPEIAVKLNLKRYV